MFWLTVSLTACGCGGQVHQVTNVPAAQRPVAKEAAFDELLLSYNAFARGVQSVNATLELKPIAGSKYTGVIDEYHEVKAFLLASRPYNIRMIGQAPVVGKTVFDMASDGQNFEVYVPSKNKFLTGPVLLERPAKNPIENLRPQHLVDALLWPEIRKEEAVLFEEFNDEAARYYVLTVLRGGYRTEILRKVWFDRADLHVARMTMYGPKGALLSDVRYADWQGVAATDVQSGNAPLIEFPRTIRIDRPHDEYRLDMGVTKISLNEPLDADRFKMEAPAGVEIVPLGDAAGDQKP
jgi:outer membrane lipoprotein-sorting protein